MGSEEKGRYSNSNETCFELIDMSTDPYNLLSVLPVHVFIIFQLFGGSSAHNICYPICCDFGYPTKILSNFRKVSKMPTNHLELQYMHFIVVSQL